MREKEKLHLGFGLEMVAVVAPLLWPDAPKPLLWAIFAFGLYLIVGGTAPGLRRLILARPADAEAVDIWLPTPVAQRVANKRSAEALARFRRVLVVSYWVVAIPGIAVLTYFTSDWVMGGWFIGSLVVVLVVAGYEGWTGKRGVLLRVLYAVWAKFT